MPHARPTATYPVAQTPQIAAMAVFPLSLRLGEASVPDCGLNLLT